jgi:release factor glutamine methyltransferase
MTGGLYTAATYGGLYSEGRFALERAGIANAALDARVLLQKAIGRTWAKLFDDEDEIASPGEINAFQDMIDKRIAHMPVAYIVGHKEFWSLDFMVNSATLVPRPESEHIVERALQIVPKNAQGRILDLGTGSGCLIISLLMERSCLTGVGVDLSPQALDMARANAAHHGVEHRCTFVVSDWASTVEGRFDLVIANPPYLSADELAAADPEVRDHEPALALSPGTDGLEACRAIAVSLPNLLLPGGWAVLEIGAGQGDAVTALLESVGLDSIGIGLDLAGLPRIVSARNPSHNKGLTRSKKRLESAS